MCISPWSTTQWRLKLLRYDANKKIYLNSLCIFGRSRWRAVWWETITYGSEGRVTIPLTLLYLLSTIYRNSELATNGGLTYFLLGGAEWRRKLLLYCLQLSNSGDALKLKVPNCIWKGICGLANNLCKVINLKMGETPIGYRGSKPIILGGIVSLLTFTVPPLYYFISFIPILAIIKLQFNVLFFLFIYAISYLCFTN